MSRRLVDPSGDPLENEGGRKIELTRKKPAEKLPGRDECFILRAPQLYRDTYSSAPPKPGQFGYLSRGQLTSAREAVHAAVRRGAMRLVDAREEIAVITAAVEVLAGTPGGSVPVMISDDPFKIREPRKKGSRSRRKNRRKR